MTESKYICLHCENTWEDGSEPSCSCSEVNNQKFSHPFRVGREQQRAVLDSKGMEVVIFPVGNESMAMEFVNYLNSKNK